ncbi:MAG: acetylxylan esterase [Planctomycetes bacterium]|nr:acetylxylan esterase [Planctomycetota bacterium]MCH9723507.1 acetylxylan esterase [Planctomycetota bacterium]MCH9775300.1 acetylxylan esterase [Planctomycetota bacterium]MCH9789213.1 acetylxylan esterase [Planctomycetota bacterium]
MKSLSSSRFCIFLLIIHAFGSLMTAAEPVPDELQRWLKPQSWNRDTQGPVIELGKADKFDDTHLFAPCVSFEKGQFSLWYCGSQGTVKKRVFQMGLAHSSDGIQFQKQANNPVFRFGDAKHSILTPTLLRAPTGATLRENTQLRMWFSSTDFQDPTGLHQLHETSSKDGIHWTAPSPAELNQVYAPTILKTGRTYQMWFNDVSKEPWCIKHATSLDGKKWRVTTDPVLEIDQEWESGRLFYPTVLKIDDVYLMWYGSYWTSRKNTTALGFAVSIDGLKWYRHPDNPVFKPDPERPWESHYVTSQSVMAFPDGSFRIWYARSKKPPFVNKYFAINTAHWNGPQTKTVSSIQKKPAEFTNWKNQTRQKLKKSLGIPSTNVALKSEKRGELETDGTVIEKWVFTSEPGSKIPAVLYRPKSLTKPAPAIVLTYGHGGSKSQWQYNYAALAYARAGLICLAIDPLGEEERNIKGRLGTRAHDPKAVHERALAANRPIMGKLVFDTMRGIDFLCQRDDVDQSRIGVAGNSLGGAVASWMAALEPRLKLAIVSGWAYSNVTLRSKYCTKVPNQKLRELCTWEEFLSLAAPDCAVMVMNGDADWIIDSDDDGTAWQSTRAAVSKAAKIYDSQGASGKVYAWFESQGGHRPYMIHKDALLWIHQHLGTPLLSKQQIQKLPTINSGRWCDLNQIQLERLYGTQLHQRGATLVDFQLSYLNREKLKCLKPEEQGDPAYSLEGWLKQIEHND